MDFTNYESAVDWLIEQRKRKGLTLRAVATAMGGKGPSLPWRIEKKTRVPSILMLQRYARGVGFELHITFDDSVLDSAPAGDAGSPAKGEP